MIGLDLPKKYLIFINLYIPQDDDNFFYRMIEKITVNFIVFIHHFKHTKPPSYKRSLGQLCLM